MPTPEDILHQVKKLTTELIGLSLCDRQNFPVLRDLAQGCQEVGIPDQRAISFTLKNVQYHEIYSELEQTNAYNLKMLDGAFIQMMYLFRNNQIEKHRLAFFPSPFLEEFQNNPEIYLEEEIYAEVINKNIVPFPLRFDFDSREDVTVEVDHPRSHLTLGQYKNCRIPVSSPVTPYYFIDFILRNFYNTAYRRYCTEISLFQHHTFDVSVTAREMGLVYVQVPRQQRRVV